MTNTSQDFLTANTYDQIETATDALIARETPEVRISDKLVDKGYISSLQMAIISELPQSKLTYEEVLEIEGGFGLVKQSGHTVFSNHDNGFYAVRIKDLFLTVSTDEELREANKQLANGEIRGYQVPREISSFQQMNKMTLNLSLSIDSLRLTRSESHFVVTAP